MKPSQKTDLRNPFGLRDGTYITVNDLTMEERGLACHCVCPLCKDPFEARLGSVRVHHFAHSGEGCDEITAYLTGLYGFFRSFVTSCMCPIPELAVYYTIDRERFTPILPDRYRERISVRPQRGYDRKKTLTKRMHIPFETGEMVTAKNHRPEAVIASYHGRKIAFVISPPDTVCKDFKAKPYKDIATLEVLLSSKADLISRADTEMMKEIFSDPDHYRWLSSPKAKDAIEAINAEGEAAHRQYLEELEELRKRQREEQEKRQQLLREKQEKEQRLLRERQEAAGKQAVEQKRLLLKKEESRIKEEKKRLEEERKQREQDRQWAEEQLRTPGKNVVDFHGKRWIQCEICGKIDTDRAFWMYQYNRGRCKECLERSKQNR